MNERNDDAVTRCPICGGGARLHTERRGMRLFRCPACGHRFSVIPAELREAYDSRYWQDTHRNWFDHPDLKLFGFLLRALREGFPEGQPRVLDVGCGTGGFLEFLHRGEPRFALGGVDYFPNEHPEIEFLQGDFLDYDFGPRRYDAICSIAVIEHVEDPVAFVRRAAELLQPGGMLALLTVDIDGLMYRMAQWADRLGAHAAFDRLYLTHHLHHFTGRSLRLAAERNGLEVTWQTPWRFPLGAVDVPRENKLLAGGYLAATAAVFGLSRLLKLEMLQVLTCKKPTTGRQK